MCAAVTTRSARWASCASWAPFVHGHARGCERVHRTCMVQAMGKAGPSVPGRDGDGLTKGQGVAAGSLAGWASGGPVGLAGRRSNSFYVIAATPDNDRNTAPSTTHHGDDTDACRDPPARQAGRQRHEKVGAARRARAARQERVQAELAVQGREARVPRWRRPAAAAAAPARKERQVEELPRGGREDCRPGEGPGRQDAQV